MITFTTKIKELYRVGEKTTKALNRLGLETVQDLLFYFPFRYDDFTKSLPIADLKVNLNSIIIVTVELIQNNRSARRRLYLTEALVSDDSDPIKIIWFNQPFLNRTI